MRRGGQPETAAARECQQRRTLLLVGQPFELNVEDGLRLICARHELLCAGQDLAMSCCEPQFRPLGDVSRLLPVHVVLQNIALLALSGGVTPGPHSQFPHSDVSLDPSA